MSTQTVPLELTAWQSVPIAYIFESKTNTRREYAKAEMEELIASIREKGIRTPLWLNAVSDTQFEIIAGSRRFRAARELGLESVPAIVYHALDEEEARELTVIENLQRQDLKPMEEAAALSALLKRGRSAKELAARIGKDARYVHRIAVLADLPKPARELVENEILPVWGAVELMRIADPSRRNEAANAVAKYAKDRQHDGEKRALDDWAVNNALRPFFLELKTAPFDTSREDLSSVGACGPCEFRTGNQGALFGAEGDADVCTKPSCFDLKTKAYREILSADAKARGFAVASTAELKRIYPNEHSDTHGAKGYVDLDQKPSYDSKRTFRQIIGGDKGLAQAAAGSVTLVFHPRDGRPVHLMLYAEVKRLAKLAGNDKALAAAKSSSSSSSGSSPKRSKEEVARERAKQEREKLEERAGATARARALALVVEDVAKKGICADDLRVVCSLLLNELEYGDVDADAPDNLCTRHGVKTVSDLRKGAAKLTLRELTPLVVDVALSSIDDHGIGGAPRFRDAVKAHGVDMAKLTKEALAEISAPPPAATAAPKKKAGKKK